MPYTTMTPAEAVDRLQEAGHEPAVAQQLVDDYLKANTEQHGTPRDGWEVDEYDLAEIEREHSRPETDAEIVQRLSDLGDQRTDSQTRLMTRLQELQEASDRTDQRDREWREEEDRAAEIDAQLDAAMERSAKVLADVDEFLAGYGINPADEHHDHDAIREAILGGPVDDDLAAAAGEAHAAADEAMSPDAYYYFADEHTHDATRGAAAAETAEALAR